MNHVLKISVIKHQVPVDTLNEDIKVGTLDVASHEIKMLQIMSGSASMQEEPLRLMEASRSISFGDRTAVLWSEGFVL